MKKISAFFLVFLFLMPFLSFSQDLNIDGDTVKISATSFPSMRFPDEIQNAKISCPDENYKLQYNGNRITIKPDVDKPVSPCQLFIDEGTEKKPRNHRFILIFTEPTESFEVYHDLHTNDLIQQRIDYLQSSKIKVAEQPAPKPDVKSAIASSGTTKDKPAAVKDNNVLNGNDSVFVLDGGRKLYRSELEKKIGDKTYMLTKCLELLIKKKENYNNAIDYGMKLFNYDETRTVQISNKKTNTIDTRPIKKYFIKMSQLQYDRVDIKWRTGVFISNIVKQEDGTYRGVVAIEQEFTGYNGNEANYAFHDVTKKKLEFTIKIWDAMQDGKEKTFMDVYLGNIGVSESLK